MGLGLLALVLLAAVAREATGGETIEASYWYVIDDIENVAADAVVELWIALPPNRADQRVAITTIEPPPAEILRDPDTGYEVVSWRVSPRPDVAHLFFHYDFSLELHPNRNTVDPARVQPYDTASDFYQRFTRSEPGIETEGIVAELAREIAADEPNPYERARIAHEWVAASITFVPGGSGERSAASVVRARRGDCGQITLAFVALCRALGIPARSVECTWFDGGRHRHAEFYLEGHGWLPADPAIAAIMIDDSFLEPGQATTFLADRGIEEDPSWLLGNGFGEHLHVFVGNNLVLRTERGDTLRFTSLFPGGVDADPPAYRIRGLNDDIVQGGFFVFDERLADEETALARAYQKLASAYFSVGAYDRVERGCIAALDSDDSFTNWMNLGRVYLAKEQYYKAEAALRRALSTPYRDAPRKTVLTAWTHNFLGNCYDMMGYRDMAVVEYQKAVDMGIESGGVAEYARKYLAEPYRKENS